MGHPRRTRAARRAAMSRSSRSLNALHPSPFRETAINFTHTIHALIIAPRAPQPQRQMCAYGNSSPRVLRLSAAKRSGTEHREDNSEECGGWRERKSSTRDGVTLMPFRDGCIGAIKRYCRDGGRCLCVTACGGCVRCNWTLHAPEAASA